MQGLVWIESVGFHGVGHGHYGSRVCELGSRTSYEAYTACRGSGCFLKKAFNGLGLEVEGIFKTASGM